MFEKLKKSPLTYMLVQIKFSERLSMDDDIKELQKTIRNEFSEFSTQTINAIDLARSKSQTSEIWHFADRTFTSGIMITTNSIVFHTSNYISFEDVKNKIKDVLTKFNKIIDIKLYSRIGLRYVNLIDKAADYKGLDSGLLGYHLKDKDIFEDVYLARCDTIQKTKVGTIKVNSMHISDISIMNGGNIYVPPDLNQGASFLSFKQHENKKPKKGYVMLDIDHFTDESGDFESRKISDQLDALHNGAFIAFRNAIDKEIWAKWK